MPRSDEKEFVYSQPASDFVFVGSDLVRSPASPAFTSADLINPPDNFLYTDKQSGGSYHADAVHFDGTAVLSANTISTADSGVISGSVWIKFNSVPLYTFPVFDFNTGSGVAFGAGTANIRFYWEDPGFTSYIQSASDQDVSSGSWHNILYSFNFGFPAGEKIVQVYLDDAPLTFADIDDDGIAFVMNFSTALVALPFFVGQIPQSYEADIAEMWIAPGQFVDLSVEDNRRKFISADGKPVSLGADGSTPTGIAPAVFFSGDSSTFGQPNLGTGGPFVLTGTLTNASTSPSD